MSLNQELPRSSAIHLLYAYDCNGNMVTRTISGSTYNLSYDQENGILRCLLTGVSGAATASFTYNADGGRVKSVAGGTTTYFVNEMVEWKGATNTMVQDRLRQFFSLGGRKIAVSAAARTGFGTGGTLNWLVGDHLGSSVVTANATGGSTGTQLYKAWGETRGTGLVGTKYQFQGQFAYNGAGEIGLQYFRARFFDPQLGRFAQADSVIPGAGNPLAWDRYAGMANNAVRNVDPSGHVCMGVDGANCSDDDATQWQISSGAQKTLFASKGHPRRPQHSESLISPLGSMKKSGYGWGANGNHPGQDFQGPKDARIRSSGYGVVIVVDACQTADCFIGDGKSPEYNGGYGNVVIIEYPYGGLPIETIIALNLMPNQSLYMLYAHMRDAPLVKVGQQVRPSQTIGYVGKSGQGGDHLHFEIRIGVSNSLSKGVMCSSQCYSDADHPDVMFNIWYYNFTAIDPNTIQWIPGQPPGLIY